MPEAFIQTHLYPQQLSEKVERFKAALLQAPLLDLIGNKEGQTAQEIINGITVFESPVSHYRQRAEFKVWHEGSESHYAMTDPETKKPIFLTQFPVASERINALMPPIMQAIHQHECLRKKLFQIEFLSTLNGDTLVTLIYHRALDEDWHVAAEALRSTLDVQIIGRSRKKKVILGRDYVNETLKVNDQAFHYQQVEGSFTQPNAAVCEKMLSWAVNNSKRLGGDLLELYCGNGNFSLPLAQNFKRVLATEISKTSVRSAQENIARNAVKNVDILRMSSEDFVQALDKVREFRRLKDIELDDYHFSTVFVDPPRAGLDSATEAMVQRFENILYISCNPETLVKNLATLCKTHYISAIAAFDQFPYTHHLETGVILQSKSAPISS